MRRLEPTKRQVERFVTASKFRYRVELVLDFDRPISVAKGREAARRALDALQASCCFEAPDTLGEISLKCPELKRIVKISVTSPSEPSRPHDGSPHSPAESSATDAE